MPIFQGPKGESGSPGTPGGKVNISIYFLASSACYRATDQ